VSFLFRDRRAEPDNQPADEPMPEPAASVATVDLAPVEFYTATDHVVATMDAAGERVTDQLNRDGSLPILPQYSDANWLESGSADATADPDWVAFDIGEVLLVVPPAQSSDPQRRLHRPRQPVEVSIGPFEVSGSVHVPPGAQASGYLYRVNPHFVPITEAVIRRVEPEPLERRDAVVLVNLQRIDRIEGAGVVEPGAAQAETS
jgi:hypothetical protein